MAQAAKGGREFDEIFRAANILLQISTYPGPTPHLPLVLPQVQILESCQNFATLPRIHEPYTISAPINQTCPDYLIKTCLILQPGSWHPFPLPSPVPHPYPKHESSGQTWTSSRLQSMAQDSTSCTRHQPLAKIYTNSYHAC